MDLKAMRRAVREGLADWEAFCPERGPCWPVARAIANTGVGRVEYCSVYCETDDKWYGHFIVRTPEGQIVDASGEYACRDCPEDRDAPYRDFAVEDQGEHEAYPKGAVEFWTRRLYGSVRSDRGA